MSNASTYTVHRPAEKNPVVRILAHVVAYVFHPLFITSYVMAFLIFLHPYAFTGFDQRVKVFRFVNIFLCNAFFPTFAVFLLWRLGFIRSMHLRNEKERIIPYIIAMIFYWWTWNVFKNLSDSPPIAVQFLLGAFLALCGGWLCNIYFKISMHGIAMGGALMFFILFSTHDAYASGLYLAIATLATGLVATSRLITGDHNAFEIYSAILIGMLAQYIGWQF
ncbi:MAG TPA: hypothetical protein VHD83_08525 [Puia sp.]|nr:hypothetical protein [Puia sp.]